MDGEVMDIQKKTKLYVATKMQGLNYDQVLVKLKTIAEYCGYGVNVEFVNLLNKEETKDKTPVECLALSILHLNEANVIIIEKYEETRGISCEEYICNKYKIGYKKVFIDWDKIYSSYDCKTVSK